MGVVRPQTAFHSHEYHDYNADQDTLTFVSSPANIFHRDLEFIRLLSACVRTAQCSTLLSDGAGHITVSSMLNDSRTWPHKASYPFTMDLVYSNSIFSLAIILVDHISAVALLISCEVTTSITITFADAWRDRAL